MTSWPLLMTLAGWLLLPPLHAESLDIRPAPGLQPFLYNQTALPENRISNQARGVLRSIRSSTLSAQINAQIIQLPFREGESFRKGDVLVTFNCEQPNAHLRAAEHMVKIRESRLETSRELARFESIGAFELLASEEEYKQALAEQDALRLDVAYCRIVAPFAGRVQAWHSSPFELAAPNQPILDIVDVTNLEVELIVDSARLPDISRSPVFQFRVDETGDQISGKVVRSLPQIDPVSKTVKVIGQLQDNRTPQVLPGMSGTATFTFPALGQR